MKYRLGSIFLLILLNVQFVHLDFFVHKITSANAYDINWELNNKEDKINKIEIERIEKQKREVERIEKQKREVERIEKQKREDQRLLSINIKNKIKAKIIARNKVIKMKNLLIQKELEKKQRKLEIEKNKIYPEFIDITSNFKKHELQQKSLSCEFAASSDILSTLEDKVINENELIALSPQKYFDKLPIRKDGKVYWENPNEGFVGYIDKLPSGKKAKQGLETGYGILEKPIANIYRKFGYNPKIITSENYSEIYTKKEHLTELLKSINNGAYVQLWGDYCTTPKYEDTKFKNRCYKSESDRLFTWYYLKDGEEVKYVGLKGEHAFVLLGYKGGVDNPTHIIVWDTRTGKHTYDIKEWYRKWDLMQNRSIIIKKK